MIKVSEPKSYPVTAYLSPRAYTALTLYHEGSGYGSMSRTIEEIILAFNDVYLLAKSMQELRKKTGKGPDSQAKDYIVSQLETIATGRLYLKKPKS